MFPADAMGGHREDWLRALPPRIEGYGEIRPFAGALNNPGVVQRAPVRLTSAVPGRSKILPTIRDAISACGLRDGCVVSVHHHLRNGDRVLELVLSEIDRAGLRDITIAPSALFPIHAPLVEYMKRGVVTGIHTAYMAGPVAAAVSRGVLGKAVTMCTHGGRARAIEAGDLVIDAAFIGAPTADPYGNINGVDGKSACGSLGYAAVDAEYARHVVAVTDNLVAYPACPIDITQDHVDFVVSVDSIGNASGIMSGTTCPTTDRLGLAIARTAAHVIAASGLLVDGFSFQTGAGGISLAVAAEVARRMGGRNIRGSFASGGITETTVDMLHAGLFRVLFDVQCFDLVAVQSYRSDVTHLAMSASMYANPHTRGAIVNMLDAIVLGATEIDTNFNVNVTTGTDGMIMGGSGGHADTAAGAKLAIVTTRLNAGGYAKVVERVTTMTTPGETIDVLVTEAGVAVNPKRDELRDRLVGHGIHVVPIEQLIEVAAHNVARLHPVRGRESVVAVVEYRDGTVTDIVRAVA